MENLALQLEEIDTLASIYYDSIQIDNELIDNAKEILENGLMVSIPDITFQIVLRIPTEQSNEIIQVDYVLTNEYPTIPDGLKINLTAISSILNRTNLNQMQNHLPQYVEKLFNDGSSTQYIFQVTEWLNEQLTDLVTKEHEKIGQNNQKNAEDEPKQYERVWIYFHHIYSKMKRRKIVDTAQQLKLTGFSYPGKPGVVCIEGESNAVSQFVQSIRSLSWQKMTIRLTEKMNQTENIFAEFSEIQMDTSDFASFLSSNNCGHIFEILFRI